MNYRKLDIQKLPFYGACMYAFVIPFHQVAATLFILIWLLFSVIGFQKSLLDKSLFLTLLPFLYLVYVVSLILSENHPIIYLERKLSFIAFPLIFFLRKYDQEEKKSIVNFLIWGVFSASITCLFLALFHSLEFDNGNFSFEPRLETGKGFFESSIYGGNYFFGQHLSIFHQTVYFALYLCVGIAFLIFDKKPSKYRTLLVVFFAFMLFLVSNKAGFLILAAVFFIALCTSKMDVIKKISVAIVGILVLWLFLFTNPRFKSSIKNLINNKMTIQSNARYDYKIRLLNWDAAIALINKRPFFGHGLGDAQNMLDKVYEEKKYTTPLKKSHNAHNQFLQIWIESGLVGVLMLVLIFIKISIARAQNVFNKGLLLSIFVTLTISAMFESIFNRFSGISFFCFLLCLIYVQSKTKRV